MKRLISMGSAPISHCPLGLLTSEHTFASMRFGATPQLQVRRVSSTTLRLISAATSPPEAKVSKGSATILPHTSCVLVMPPACKVSRQTHQCVRQFMTVIDQVCDHHASFWKSSRLAKCCMGAIWVGIPGNVHACHVVESAIVCDVHVSLVQACSIHFCVVLSENLLNLVAGLAVLGEIGLHKDELWTQPASDEARPAEKNRS